MITGDIRFGGIHVQEWNNLFYHKNRKATPLKGVAFHFNHIRNNKYEKQNNKF